jgi:peroxiredoxin
MKRALFIFVVIIAAAFAASAQAVAVGGTVADIPLSSLDGKAINLNDIKGTNGVVLIFVSAQCPVVRGYNERMNQLAIAYKAKGINVVGVNANVTESPEQIKAHADATYKFPVYIDKGAVVADKLGATVTPEAYFLDGKNTLLYHGAIDNDRSGEKVTEHFLTAAFDSSLAGKKIEHSSRNAFGCTIKRSVE